MRRFLIVFFVCCLAVPGRVSAETAREYLDRGKVLILKGEYDKAVSDFDKALSINPKNADAFRNRGLAWLRKGDRDKAIADFTKSLGIDPKSAWAYTNRGLAWWRKGEYDKALPDYLKAVEIDTNFVPASNNLASFYATCPDAQYRDGWFAVQIAGKAYKLTGGKDGGVCDTLAAAYAESGDFAKARELQEKAIELAAEKKKPQFRSRLELYKQGKPYHEPPVKK